MENTQKEYPTQDMEPPTRTHSEINFTVAIEMDVGSTEN